MCLYLILRIIPIAGTFYLSLHKWNLIGINRPFVGLRNFIGLLADSSYRDSINNTLLYVVLVVAISVVLALLFALAFEKIKKFGSFYEFAYFLPVVIPMVPVAMVWKWMYDTSYGIINFVITGLGLEPIGWLTNTNIALYSIVIMSIWKVVGYYMVLFLVGLRNIPGLYYEAASVDGASSWQQFWYITLPLLKRISLYICVIATIQAFKVFTPVYVMTTGSQGVPAANVRVMVYEIYQNGFRYFKMGYASAQVVVLFLIVMFISLIQFELFRTDED